ncbi:hypothetical protein SUGI_0643040 [Cryptomeria japonica]|nr:hypothetical protein SUGI_0643040 [Cryptomeria japonica]
MAYVPPHRRAKSSSKPETPPHSVNKVYKYPARDDDAARSNVFIWFPVDEHVNPPANVQLDFKPFAGRSFPHLEDKKLYTISVNPNPVDGNTLKPLRNCILLVFRVFFVSFQLFWSFKVMLKQRLLCLV